MGIAAKPFTFALRRGHPLAPGLIGAWVYNDLYGATVLDMSGYGNHETLTNGPSWTVLPGCGRGLSFASSTQQKGSCGNVAAYSFTNGSVDLPFTFCIGAINIAQTYTTSFFQKYDTGQREYFFGTSYAPSNGKCGLYIYTPDGSQYRGRETAYGAVETDAVTNIVGMYSGNKASSGISIYPNARRVDVSDLNSGGAYSGMTASSAEFRSGQTSALSNPGGAAFAYRYIYNRVLTQSEISWLNHDPYTMFRPRRILVAGVDYAALASPRSQGIEMAFQMANENK